MYFYVARRVHLFHVHLPASGKSCLCRTHANCCCDTHTPKEIENEREGERMRARQRSRYTNCKSCSMLCVTTQSGERVLFLLEGNNVESESKALWFGTICCMFYLMLNWNTIFIRGQPNPNVFYICSKAKSNENISTTKRTAKKNREKKTKRKKQQHQQQQLTHTQFSLTFTSTETR